MDKSSGLPPAGGPSRGGPPRTPRRGAHPGPGAHSSLAGFPVPGGPCTGRSNGVHRLGPKQQGTYIYIPYIWHARARTHTHYISVALLGSRGLRGAVVGNPKISRFFDVCPEKASKMPFFHYFRRTCRFGAKNWHSMTKNVPERCHISIALHCIALYFYCIAVRACVRASRGLRIGPIGPLQASYGPCMRPMGPRWPPATAADAGGALA